MKYLISLLLTIAGGFLIYSGLNVSSEGYIFTWDEYYTVDSEKSVAYHIRLSDYEVRYELDKERLVIQDQNQQELGLVLSKQNSELLLDDWVQLDDGTRIVPEYCKYLRIQVSLVNPGTKLVDTAYDSSLTIDNRRISWRCLRELTR